MRLFLTSVLAAASAGCCIPLRGNGDWNVVLAAASGSGSRGKPPITLLGSVFPETPRCVCPEAVSCHRSHQQKGNCHPGPGDTTLLRAPANPRNSPNPALYTSLLPVTPPGCLTAGLRGCSSQRQPEARVETSAGALAFTPPRKAAASGKSQGYHEGLPGNL